MPRDGSRDQIERGGVSGADHAEVPPIKRRDHGLSETLSERYHACVPAAEGHISVGLNQVSNPGKVGAGQLLNADLAVSDRAKEARLRCWPELATDEIGRLRDHKRRGTQR